MLFVSLVLLFAHMRHHQVNIEDECKRVIRVLVSSSFSATLRTFCLTRCGLFQEIAFSVSNHIGVGFGMTYLRHYKLDDCALLP